MTDPIADFVTQIRNGVRAGKDSCQVQHSKLKREIARILKECGYIKGYEDIDEPANKKFLKVELKYVNGQIAADARVKMIRLDSGQVTYGYVSSDGNVYPFYLTPGEYILTGAPNNADGLTTFYKGVLCDQEWSPSCVTEATIINVEYGSEININDFEIFSNGSIAVNITRDVSGNPLSSHSVKIYNEDSLNVYDLWETPTVIISDGPSQNVS